MTERLGFVPGAVWRSWVQPWMQPTEWTEELWNLIELCKEKVLKSRCPLTVKKIVSGIKLKDIS